MKCSTYPGVLVVPILLVVSVGGGLLACSNDTTHGEWLALSERLVDGDPEQRFDETFVFESRTVFDLSLDELAAATDWVLAEEAGSVPVTTLTRELPLDTASLDALEVESAPLGRGRVVVRWWIADQDKESSIEVALANRTSDDAHVYRLSLAGHPNWRGTATRLRIELVPQRGLEVELKRLRGVEDELRQAALAEVLATAWKVEIGNDLRNALMVIPGAPSEFSLDRPAAELRFAYGVLGIPTFPILFKVVCRTDDRDRRVLFSETLQPGDEESTWHEATVDLANVPPRSVLTLETEFPGGADPFTARTFPFWAHPEILARSKARQPTLVIISIDTLRADHLSLYGYARPTTPHIDAWARRRAAVFETAIAPAPWTLPSHVSLFTGLDALVHGVNFASPAPPGLTMLAEVLRREGYHTVAVTGGGFVHPQWGFAQGFDSYRFFGERMGFEEELATGLGNALEVLSRNSDRPLFLFFHTYEVHNPFRARQPFFSQFSSLDPQPYHVRIDQPEPELADGFLSRRQFTLLTRGKALDDGRIPPELESLAVDLYDSGIAYTDSMLKTLLEELTENGRQGSPLVILSSDHGESFGEHGVFSHTSLYEHTLRIPLMIAAPDGLGAGNRIASQVGLIDVMPTVLEILEIDGPTDLDGTSLVPLLAGGDGSASNEVWSYAATSNYGISLRLANGLKYLFRHSAFAPAQNREQLFELADDPHEGQDLAAEIPQTGHLRDRVARRMRAAAAGLHFEIANREPEALRGALLAPRGLGSRLKTAPGQAVEFNWNGARRTEFAIAPGRTARFWLEDLLEGRLRLSLSSGERLAEPETGLNLELRVEELVEPRRLVLRAGEWHELDRPNLDGATTLSIFWIGSRHLQPSSAAVEIDPRVRDQLEALGYVD